MKKFFSIILCCHLILTPFLYSQEEGEDDFLDKVSEEKPKKVLKSKNQKNLKGKIRKRRKKLQTKTKNSISSKTNFEHKKSTENFSVLKSNEGGWINEEMEIQPGIETKKEIPQEKETSVSKEKKIFEFSNEHEKPKEAIEKPIETKSILDNVFGTFSDYKKILIIIGLIIVFAIYRLRAGKSKNSISNRGSPRTISNFRKK